MGSLGCRGIHCGFCLQWAIIIFSTGVPWWDDHARCMMNIYLFSWYMCIHNSIQWPEKHCRFVLSDHLLYCCDYNKSYSQICSPYPIIFSAIHSDILWQLAKIAPEYQEHPYIFTVNT